ncbi:peroxiredoxin family protein [Methylovorus glucosotrophus]|jgi:peroxiredoxin|uniref:Redoxin domain protein n=1 Tax=Methylovorus glucosotrophus (strain SIP3-4) TaxID=582744 RepID=C6X9W4_METGS|nr:TlpA disulfide reductase family protein [Methylovorus glucosotrophus]ACT51505.1 Redoxin domain protein [Methylovorus glucosotrophus SIP3-4]
MKSLFNSPRKLLFPLLLVLLLGFLAYTLASKPTAPNISFTTLDGKTSSMQDLRGKVVLVNFWATDCPGCIAEMPALIQTWHQYHERGFEVVAIAMPYDPIDQVKNYTAKNSLPFKVTHDDSGDMSMQFNEVRVTPTTFVLDKDGKIIRKAIGELDFKSLHELLDQQLGTKG